MFIDKMLPRMLALLCLASVPAQAQTAPLSSVTKATPPPQTAAAVSEGTMLDTDPRLKQKVTLRLDNVTMSKALAQLSASTKISLIADGDQLQTKKLSAAFINKPMRDVLDAIAALGDYEWVGRKSGVFVLRAIPPVLIDPKLAKWGKTLKGLVDGLTPDQQSALSKPYGTTLGDLPPDMQSAIQGALSTLHDPTGPDGQPIPMYENILSNPGVLRVGFEVNHQEDGNDYYLSYAGPDNSGGTVLVYHE